VEGELVVFHWAFDIIVRDWLLFSWAVDRKMVEPGCWIGRDRCEPYFSLLSIILAFSSQKMLCIPTPVDLQRFSSPNILS
jgi:hypothetical protein